jgi:hypothetical protein
MIKPHAALLKFRLKWRDRNDEHKAKLGDTIQKYIRGRVMLPIWAPSSSTECRLYCNKFLSGEEYELEHNYDYHQIEEQMAYFQHTLRVATYPKIQPVKFPVTFFKFITKADGSKIRKPFHDVEQSQTGYCECYDCVRDQQIIQRMLLQKFKSINESLMSGRIMERAIRIKEACYKQPHDSIPTTTFEMHPTIGAWNSHSEADEDMLPNAFQFLNNTHMHKSQ